MPARGAEETTNISTDYKKPPFDPDPNLSPRLFASLSIFARVESSMSLPPRDISLPCSHIALALGSSSCLDVFAWRSTRADPRIFRYGAEVNTVVPAYKRMDAPYALQPPSVLPHPPFSSYASLALLRLIVRVQHSQLGVSSLRLRQQSVADVLRASLSIASCQLHEQALQNGKIGGVC